MLCINRAGKVIKEKKQIQIKFIIQGNYFIKYIELQWKNTVESFCFEFAF